jgi:hypothetical protein
VDDSGAGAGCAGLDVLAALDAGGGWEERTITGTSSGGGFEVALSAGAGTDSRRGLGGGARRREAPGGFESVRGREGSATGGGGGDEIVGALGVVTRGGGGMPAASAALVPGGGRLGVPIDSTGMLGIFAGSLVGAETEEAGASGGFDVIRPSAVTRRSEGARSHGRPRDPARATAPRWNRGEKSRSRRPCAAGPRARSGVGQGARPGHRAR